MSDSLSNNIIRCVLYFDIFSHPVKSTEVTFFCENDISETKLNETLFKLVQTGKLHQAGEYYSIRPDIGALIERRIEGERNAQLQLDKAWKRAKLIGKFPYVQAAYISGSMSKGVLHDDGDVDFFIITKPGRLWVARSLLILFKKTVLFNSRKFFCLNYFIDSSQLEIEEKNIFTATETVTLRPIYDNGMFNHFLEANNWVKEFVPNGKYEQVVYNGTTSRPIGDFVEKMLDNSFGDKLDEWFMNVTLTVWKRKFQHMKEADFEIALKTRKYVSKHHPRNFQSRVLQAFDQRIASFERKHRINIR